MGGLVQFAIGMRIDVQVATDLQMLALAGKVQTSEVESFKSILKQVQEGLIHKISSRHLERYVQELARNHGSGMRTRCRG